MVYHNPYITGWYFNWYFIPYLNQPTRGPISIAHMSDISKSRVNLSDDRVFYFFLQIRQSISSALSLDFFLHIFSSWPVREPDRFRTGLMDQPGWQDLEIWQTWTKKLPTKKRLHQGRNMAHKGLACHTGLIFMVGRAWLISPIIYHLSRNKINQM